MASCAHQFLDQFVFVIREQINSNREVREE
jgi:hypothetical protein